MIRPIVASSLLAASVQAQTAPGNIVVTASRLAGPTPNDTVPLPAADLAASDSVADALARLPDVYVQQPGGRSGFGALFLRGADPNFTTVFLDGIPLNNATSSRGGAVNLSEVGSAGIARADLVAGPLSSVHGSGALAGAVNLVLAGGGDHHRLTASAGAGSRGDATAVLGWRGPIGRGIGSTVGGSITAEYDNDGAAYPGAAFESVAVTAKLAPRDGNRPDKLIFRISDSVARTFPDNSGGPDLAVIRTTERRTAREWLGGGNYRLLARPGLFIDAAGSWLSRRETSAGPGVAASAFDPFGIPAGNDTSRYDRGLAQLTAGIKAGPSRLVAGVEAQQERGRSDGALDFGGFAVPTAFRIARTTVAGFVEGGHGIGPLTVTAAARIDAIDGLAPRPTGRAGLRYQAGDVALTASGGTSFKAPSFYALGNPFVGNPALRPEGARSIEAGVTWSPAPRRRLSLAVFHNRLTDLIDFVADPAPRLVNRRLVTTAGFVASLAQPLGAAIDLGVRAQYARSRSDTPLLNRPAWRAGATVDWRTTAALTITGRYDFTDRRRDVAVPTGPRILSATHLIGVVAIWQALPGLSVLAAVDNALDADYSDAIGFPGPGRRARLLVTQSF